MLYIFDSEFKLEITQVKAPKYSTCGSPLGTPWKVQVEEERVENV